MVGFLATILAPSFTAVCCRSVGLAIRLRRALAYRGNERTGDFGGVVAGELPLEHDEPDVADPATGFLWDKLARHDLTYRDYGEYVSTVWCGAEGEGTASRPPSARCTQPDVSKGKPLAPNPSMRDRRTLWQPLD
jgi:hypothetical protein